MLGRGNMDMVVRTVRLPVPGETVLGSDFRTGQGGKGANQAIAAARAGADVALIGAVGTDAFGAELADTLQAERIATDRLRVLDGPSGIAVITVDDDAENTIVVAGGANDRVTALSAADEEEIGRADLLVMQLELPLQVVLAGAVAARAAGVSVLLNPSPARVLPAELPAMLTMVVVNEGEAAVLGAEALAAVPHVVTTLGSRGARYRGPDGATTAVPAPPVTPVDTTGAGDAFTGALAVAWMDAAPAAAPSSVWAATTALEAATLRWACAAGALATQSHGAGRSAPRRHDIARLAGAGPSRPHI